MNILIVTAHPSTIGHTHIIANTYAKEKLAKNDNVKIVDLYAKENRVDFLSFEDIKDFKQSDIQKKFQADVSWTDEIVVVHPIWWGTPPSIMKNWTELTFWSNFAYKYEQGGTTQKLLTGKTAKVFATCGGPSWYYNFPILPLYSFWKISLFGFFGVKVTDLKVCGQLNRTKNGVAEKNFEKFLKKVVKSARKN